MRIYLFIFLAVLVVSCSTTKEYDCDYSDYKTISIEDFEWVREVEFEGALIDKGDSVFYSFPDLWLEKPPKSSKLSRIDVSNGSFIDTVFSKEVSSSNWTKQNFDISANSFEFVLESPSNSCINELNLLFRSPLIDQKKSEKSEVAIEIIINILSPQKGYGKYKFLVYESELRDINDFIFYKGCYLILSFKVDGDKKYIPTYRLGLLDLQKLIDNY